VRFAFPLFLLSALTSCRQGGTGPEPIAPQVAATYPASLAPWPGTVGDRLVVEMVGVDDGRPRWRDGTGCQALVAHVTREVVVCSDAMGMTALDVRTGGVLWKEARHFAGAEDDLIVATATDEASFAVLDAATGVVVAESAPPPGILARDVRRACPIDGGLELWTWGESGFARFTMVQGGAPGPVAQLALPGAPAKVDACGGTPLVELPIAGSIERTLYALAREPLATLGYPVVERGFWRGEPGEVVVATGDGIEIRDGALGGARRVSDAQVGRELAARGRRRLVRGAAGLPVLLEDHAPVSYLSGPVHVDSAVLGDRYVLGGGWQAPMRSNADHVDRFLLPAGEAGAEVPALVPGEPPDPPIISRDLPAEAPPGAAAVELPGAGAHDVGIVFLDPADPAILYAAPMEARPSDQRGAGIAAFDLRARSWRWHAPDGCPAGTPVAVAVARAVIACGSRGPFPGSGKVRAIARDGGTVLWTWEGATVDAVTADGDLVVVTVGRRARVLDAATGTALATVAADDGFLPRVVPFDLDGTGVLIGLERGAVVARVPRAAMMPLWSVEVRGVVTAIASAGGRITVELASGELYLLDPRSGAATAAAGWARRWRPVGGSDLVLAEPQLPAGEEWRLFGSGADGAPRFAAGLAVEPPWLVGARGRDPAAPLALAYGPAARFVAIVDPWSGQVRARVALPARAVPGAAFATVVDGMPVAGAVLSQPLAAVLF
jgi:hypothetical protein